MPDSPKVKRDNSSEDDEVELVEETQKPKNSSSWPQTLQDLKNNNNKPLQNPSGQPLIYPRPSSDLLRPAGLMHPLLQPRFAAAAATGTQPQLPLNFTGWLYIVLRIPVWTGSVAFVTICIQFYVFFG